MSSAGRDPGSEASGPSEGPKLASPPGWKVHLQRIILAGGQASPLSTSALLGPLSTRVGPHCLPH
jgi:hypothetical protein